jgi:hypothetical protein
MLAIVWTLTMFTGAPGHLYHTHALGQFSSKVECERAAATLLREQRALEKKFGEYRAKSWCESNQS